MNFLVINNSTNPDMTIYFDAKKNIRSQKITLAANALHRARGRVLLSSISPKNELTWHFFIDCLISLSLAIKIKIKGINCLLFDTAHISNIPLAFAAKFLKMKLVFTIHDWNPHEGNMAGATRLYNRVVENFLADHFIVFSPIDSDVPHSVLTLSGFKSNFAKSKTYNQAYLFFGRVEPYKGLHNLVDIAKKIETKMPSAVINVMGSGSDKAIDSLVEMSNVNVVNEFISEEKLNLQLKKTTAVLLPYDSATQSGVIIKSFSVGVPVIAYDVGALKYYVDDGTDGILVRHGDVSGFVEAMIEISERFTVFSEAVEKKFVRKYSEKALVRQYEDLLATLGVKFERNK